MLNNLNPTIALVAALSPIDDLGPSPCLPVRNDLVLA